MAFRISEIPTQGFWSIEKARLRRWALCALRTPRSQAERALHRTSQKAAVRASVLVCATSRGCRWVVSSAHPAREAAGPLARAPSPDRTHGTWLVFAALRPALTCTPTGPLGTESPFVLCRFVVAPCLCAAGAMHPACWCLQSTTDLTARCSGAQHAPWPLHWRRAPCRACRLCGSATTPYDRPEQVDGESPPRQV